MRHLMVFAALGLMLSPAMAQEEPGSRGKAMLGHQQPPPQPQSHPAPPPAPAAAAPMAAPAAQPSADRGGRGGADRGGERGDRGGRTQPTAPQAAPVQTAPAQQAMPVQQPTPVQQGRDVNRGGRDNNQDNNRFGRGNDNNRDNDNRFGRGNDNRDNNGRGDWRRDNNGRGDNRGFNNRGRHDFNSFRDFHRTFRAPHRYRAPTYRRPSGWYSHRWSYGEFLPTAFWARDYWLYEYEDYGLAEPPYGAVWVRVGTDALLIDEDTGEVITVEYDVFY